MLVMVRTNIGNAMILGLEDDLGLSNDQDANGLAIFFVFYIALELPSNLVLKRLTPRVWLSLLTICWGITGMCLGFVRNYGGFLIVRAFLGLCEGGLLPGMVLYLSSMYTLAELALRVGLFCTTASLSGAFGGLLARGLNEIPRTSIVDAGWRWIMIIEGILSVVIGVTAYFFLPNSVSTARFLSDKERIVAQLVFPLIPKSMSEPEKFRWSEVRRGIINPQLWLSASASFAILAGRCSFGLFLPTIITGLGYKANEAQLFTVPPYAAAAAVTVIIAFISDRQQLRGVVMLFTIPIAIVGLHNNAVNCGVTFLRATRLYASVPPVLVWIRNNSAGHYKRATTTGMQLAIANCGGFVTTFIYPSSEKPQDKKSHEIVLGLRCYPWFVVLCNVFYCAKVNRGKARGKYDKYIELGDDREPGFRMVL